MRLLSYQNLNSGLGIFHGRAWIGGFDCIRAEWAVGRKSDSFSAKIEWMHGDSNRDVMIVFGIPWLFTIYLSFCGIIGKWLVKEPWKMKERQFGIAYHNNALWFYPGSKAHEWNSRDPWWDRNYSITMPWEYWHLKTEILKESTNGGKDSLIHFVYWEENCRTYWRSLWDKITRNGRPSRTESGIYKTRDEAEKAASVTKPYRYVRKNGEIQNTTASVRIERHTCGMRWFPFIKKSRTSLWCNFSNEIGEGVESWKGGTTGAGIDMLPGETLDQALVRMQNTRKFER